MLQLDEAISALNVEQRVPSPALTSSLLKTPRCSENLPIHFFITIGGGSYPGSFVDQGRLFSYISPRRWRRRTIR